MPGTDITTHPSIVQEADGLWFQEKSEQWPGMAQTLKVEKILWTEKSLYQDVLVFQSTNNGTILVLDGAIQCSTKDEFSYQEMITHLALNSHPNPKNVLVIGGGDGGVLREVIKHPGVESATLVDIDEAVPRLSKKFLPQMAIGFDDPRTETLIMDGFEYLKEHKNKFDCIITDSSDPEGPAEVLFQKPYFELLNDALREGGVITTQGESIWLHADLIKGLRKTCKEIFPVVEYAYTTIPTYPSGQIGFMVCCKDKTRDVKTPVRSVSQEEEMEKYSYYSQAIHRASFVLPNFAIKALQ